MKKSVSEEKLRANRENARKSTGPKTERGKANSRKNATKHGAYSTRRILAGENEELYDAIRNEQIRLFKPQTFVAKALVDQLVGDLWTLRRLARAENLLYRNTAAEVERGLLKAPDPFSMLAAQQSGTFEPLKEDLKMQEKAGYRALKSWPAAVFEHLYFDEQNQSAFERIAAFKTKLMSNILSIERELMRRRDEG